VAVFVASFLLMTVLPRGAGRRPAGHDQAAALAGKLAAADVIAG
jgi:hypothetical protein